MERIQGLLLGLLLAGAASSVPGWSRASAADAAKVVQTQRAAALIRVGDRTESKPLLQVLPPVAPGALRTAAYNADPEAVEDLLRRGANANDPSPHGLTPLHRAADRLTDELDHETLMQEHEDDCARVVALLLQYGADVDAVDDRGRTPLHAAVRHDFHEPLVRMLVERGAQVNARGPGGATPLFLAARNDAPYVAIDLLEHGADPNLANESGLTPAMAAAARGNSRALDVLLEYGADANLHSEPGGSALLWATRSLSQSYLLSADTPQGRGYVASLGQAARDALWKELSAGDEEFGFCAALLLGKGGADPNVTAHGQSPLTFAATAGDGELVATLIAKRMQRGSPPVGAGDFALHVAVGEGHADVADQLIRAGADVNARSDSGLTPLHFSAGLTPDKDLAEMLISRGADVNARDQEGRTPLAHAMRAGNEPVAAVLRQHGGT